MAMSKRNGPPKDAPPPVAAGRRVLEHFMWHWQHEEETGRVLLTITPAIQIEGMPPMRDGDPVVIVFVKEGWDAFGRDVARGGHSSPVAIAKVVPE